MQLQLVEVKLLTRWLSFSKIRGGEVKMDCKEKAGQKCCLAF